MHTRRSVLLAALLGATSHPALSQEVFPSRPLSLVIPFPAGGASDNLGRKAAAMLSQSLGQSVVVDNRPGAGGNLALDAVVRGKADGYTVLQAFVSLIAINPHTYKNQTVDPVKDLTPLRIASAGPLVLAVHPTLPVRSLQELVSYSKANPGKLSYASAGNGGITHVGMELLKARTGIQADHVPYKGGAAAMPDLLSGRVQVMLDTQSQLLPFVRDNKLRVLAVTSEQRSVYVPDAPTVAESGFADFAVTAWTGFFVPARTPASARETLRSALDKVIDSREFGDFMVAGMNTRHRAMNPDEIGQFVKSEYERWGKVVRDSKIEAD